jgi:putative addiction module component (TIGR02574 family)
MPARSIRLLGSPCRRTISTVTKAAETVLAEALELDAHERAEVAAELIASLDGEADESVEAAWAAEIERRMAAIDAGTATLTPWADVKSRIEEKILKK